MFKRALIVFCSLLWTACSTAPPQPVDVFDLILRGGTVYDGRGDAPYVADMGVRGDRVVCVGDLSRAQADISIDARGRAVAPGFINVVSWAPE
jgi:N-acyl-D-amino-acid deacylase